MTFRPIRRLLVANRGEIAVRTQRTAQRMGIHTIAIYSEADRYAPHVEMANERYFLGVTSPPKPTCALRKFSLSLGRPERMRFILAMAFYRKTQPLPGL